MDIFCGKQQLSVFVNILKMHPGRSGGHAPGSAPQVNRTNRIELRGVTGREPDFVALWRPCETLNALELLGQDAALSLRINHTHGATIVADNLVIEKRDLLAGGGESDIADITYRLVQHLADRVFKAVVVPDLAGYS